MGTRRDDTALLGRRAQRETSRERALNPDQGPGERFSPVSPAHPLDEVLRQVNQLRGELGADPIYELPKAQSAMDAGSDCVLERAFEDLQVVCVDYRFIVGRGYRLEHGLGSFIKRFDDGRYPELVAEPRAT